MSEYAFLFAKIRGKLAKMVELAAYEELLRGAGADQVIERLRETPYGAHLGEGAPDRVADRLLRGLFAEVTDLLFVLDGRDRALIEDVMAKYRLENVKALLRGYIHRLPPEEVQPHLLELPWEEARAKVDWGRLSRLGGLEAFIKELPWREWRARLEVVFGQVGEVDNPFPYEAELDSLYLERLLARRQERKEPGVKAILGNRLLKELVLWGYRLRGYGRSFPEIVTILPDFRSLIPLEEMQAILEEEGGWRRLARWLSLSPPAAERLRRAEEKEEPDLGMLSQLFDEELIRQVKRLLLMGTMDIAIVIGYIYWKELEVRGLIQLVERARTRG